MIVTINNTDYSLATTLRVAYKVQGQHNHKPYAKVFSEIGDMVLEDQIGILFAAFQVANPQVKLSQEQFLNHYLDNYNLKVLMDQVKDVVQGIMGTEEGWTCTCGANVTTKFCPECGTQNPEFVPVEQNAKQGN